MKENHLYSRSCSKDNFYHKWRHISCPINVSNRIICRKCMTIDSILRRSVSLNKQLKKLHIQKREKYETKQHKKFKTNNVKTRRRTSGIAFARY